MGGEDEAEIETLLTEILNRPKPEENHLDREMAEAQRRDTEKFLSSLIELEKFVASVKSINQSIKELGLSLSTDIDAQWYDVEDNAPWEIELLVEKYEVIEMRLPRDRKGKTPIDVGIVVQDGLKRVRLSMGEDNQPGRKNSDLSIEEAENLITMLQYNVSLAKGDIKSEE